MTASGAVSKCFVRYPLTALLTSAFSLISSASGLNCSYQIDCSGQESCCDNVCVAGEDCLGVSCSNASNCKAWERCCDGICSEYCISSVPFNVDIIIASVLASCILLCATSLCCYFTCRPIGSKQPPANYGRMIVGQGVTATTFTTRCATQGDASYLVEAVPGYPPNYVEYTQYKQEEPSSYSNVKPWRAGGMYTPLEEHTDWHNLSTPYL